MADDKNQMKVLIITSTLSEKSGLGRYSLEMIKRLPRSWELLIFSGREEDGLKEIKNGKIFQVLPGPFELFKLRNPFLVWRLARKIRRQAAGVDFVHSFMDYPHSFLAALVARALRKPLFLTAHGTYSLSPLNRWPDKYFCRFALKSAKKVFCISRFTEEEIKKRVSLVKTVAINNGIDFEKFNCAAASEKTEGKMILSVGLVKARKGYHISIPAIAQVKRKYPKVKYYIVGQKAGENYFHQLQLLVKKYSLTENVIFLEGITDDELKRLYRRADVFLLTPVNINDNFEGFGLVYLEAGACGKPVIGTKGCGAQEAVEDGRTGILVEQNDVDGTAQAVLKLLDDPKLAERMGQAGREKAKLNDWKQVVQKYTDVYQGELKIPY